MTQLKTLTDLIANEGFVPEECCSVSLTDLKQEAIKWIKLLANETNLIRTNNFHLPYQPKPEEWIQIEQRLSKIDWIKHFFNITEEELR